ncbi:MAG TPA: permease, partial [Actinoallomurus sp.]|nr:permease [Actinoallomurus sp.]
MSVESGRRSSPLLMTLPLLAVIAVAGLTWAKWWPYTLKLQSVLSDRSWAGTSILSSGGTADTAPSLAGGWDFTLAYGRAVWKALVVALLLAAAVETLVPRRRLMAALSGRGAYGGALAGGLLSLPCMMCTCCTAPLARTLRRNGAPTSSVLAYWLGNPTLNPAVLAFLAIVAPWQWFAVRLLAGAVLVFGVTVVIGRLAGRDAASPVPAAPEEEGAATVPRRFAGALGRLSLTLVPEYAVVVFAIGTFRGWIFPLDDGAAHWAIPALIAAATLGTLVVIPTAGEIPILLGLAAAGA